MSPTLFEECFKAPDKTQQATRGGGEKISDIGRLDEEGYLYLADRKKTQQKAAMLTRISVFQANNRVDGM